MNRKLFAGLLCLIMLVSLTACGEEAVQSSASKTFTALTSVESTDEASQPEPQPESQPESQAPVQSAASQPVASRSFASSAPPQKESTAPVSSVKEPDTPKEPAIYCTFTLKTHEEILLEGTVEILKNDTAYSVLMRVCGEKNIAVKKRGSNFMGWYIEAVNGLAEDTTKGSGWKYEVNGVEPGKPSSAYPIKENDVLIWKYIIE